MPIFLIVLQQEMLLTSRNLGRILVNLLFFLMMIVVFSIISSSQNLQGSVQFYLATVVLISMISCIIFSTTDFLKKDFEDGTIEQILAYGENFEIFIIAKILGNWLNCCLPILIAMPLASLTSNLNLDFTIQLILMVFLASLAINFICSFCGSLATLSNSAPLIAIIALPLIIPILLITCGGLIENNLENFWLSIKILLGIIIFVGGMAVLGCSKIIKIAAE